MAAAIVVSCFVGFEVALMVENEIVALEAGVTYAQAAAAVSAGWTAGTAGGAIASFGELSPEALQEDL